MKARVLAPTPEHLREAARLLLADEVVGMPTETVYGLAGRALSPAALTRIFSTKERPTFDPLIVHVESALGSLEALEAAGLVDLKALGSAAHEAARRLIAAFWPGPLTLVLPKLPGVPDLATSGLPTLALRMPAHPVAQALLREARTPLAAPSANRFGRISPTSAQAVVDELGDRIPLVLDGGPCAVGVESTVLAVLENGALQCLRPGGVPLEAVRALLPEAPLTTAATQAAGAPLPGPGLLESHYAPRTPLELLAEPVSKLLALRPPPGGLGLLAFTRDPAAAERELRRALGGDPARAIAVRALDPAGDLALAARALFSALRELDQAGLARIYAEPCPQAHGLGHAIADRLARAAAVKRPSSKL